jgi:phage FluMu protein Com
MTLRRDTDVLSAHAKTLCVDHRCPRCGGINHVTIERVVVRNTTLTRCHCRVCEFSWHPQQT